MKPPSVLFVLFASLLLCASALIAADRSPRWPTVRKQHLQLNPACAVCAGTAKLEVHHLTPFHLAPRLELMPTNLITLCRANKHGLNCHLLIGHLGSFRSFNPEAAADALTWSNKLALRPMP